MDFSEYGIPSKEWSVFVADNPSAARDGYANNDIAEADKLRSVSNESRRSNSRNMILQTGLDKSVEITTVLAKSRGLHMVPIRRYEPRRTKKTQREVLVYIHGGGYLLGDEESDDFVCASIAETIDVIVLSIIYRHTHRYRHPSQVDDVWDAFKYIQSNHGSLGIPLSSRITLMGISAGAGLAASVALRELEEVAEASAHTYHKTPTVTGLLLAMPWLLHIDNYPFHLFKSPHLSSKEQCVDAPVVPRRRMRLFTDLLAADSPDDALLNIALTPDNMLTLWPKTAIIVAGMDPLRDDGLIFAKRLQQAG